MSQAVLPHRVNTRKALGREACYKGGLGAAQLPDFAEILQGEDEDIGVRAEVRFGRDDEDRAIVDVVLNARVRLECQRSLETFSQTLSSRSRLGLVLTDEQAKNLPREYEPLMSGEETDLWAVVAEELSLALPVVAYHPDTSRQMKTTPAGDEGLDDADAAKRSGPFDVLSVLLDESATDASKK